MQKNRVSIVIWLSILLTVGTAYLFLQKGVFATIESRVRDLFFIPYDKPSQTNRIVIVDIDEKSLQALGQWPWERSIVAQLIEILSRSGAAVIGLDMVFAEADKTSPSYIDHKLHLRLDNPLDYDVHLAKSLQSAPIIAGYTFNMESNDTKGKVAHIPGLIIERNKQGASIRCASGVISNIPILQESAYSSGFFNVFPDEDGIIRSIPLLIGYQENLYPSLALEMVRYLYHEDKVIVQYTQDGVVSVAIGEREIPTERDSQMAIRFRGPSRTFTYVSAIDVLRHDVDEKLLQDKLILIGSSSSGLFDLRATPIDNVIAGVEIHANIIDNILQGDFLFSPDWVFGFDVLFFIVLFSVFYILFLSLGIVGISLVALAGLVGLYFAVRWILFSHGILIDVLAPFVALVSALLSAVFINYFYESRQRKQIRRIFDKKVSPSVVEELINHEDILQNREEEITILFSDIREFTTIAEQIGSPQRLIALLNSYITPMTEIILEQKGTVDKFMGDGIMAYWNAPKPLATHADMAVTTALMQQEALVSLNKEIYKEYGVEFQIGIGINTGKAIVGEIGSVGRSDYTVIGDSINLASRIEHLNKQYHTKILISEYTKNALFEQYEIHEIDTVQVKGKHEKVRIFEVLQKI